jgi:hypothetical protein
MVIGFFAFCFVIIFLLSYSVRLTLWLLGAFIVIPFLGGLIFGRNSDEDNPPENNPPEYKGSSWTKREWRDCEPHTLPPYPPFKGDKHR